MSVTSRQDQFAERRYPASPLRLEEAAREGRTPRSADLVAALAALAAVLAVAWLAPTLLAELTAAFRRLLGSAGESLSAPAGAASAADGARGVIAPLVATAALVALAAMAMAAGAGALQGGWRIVLSNVRPDWGRVRPGAGGRRLFSRPAMVRLAWAIVKTAAVAALAAGAISGAMNEICRAPALDAGGIARLAGGLAVALALRVGAALLLLAACDYLYQRWEHRQSLQMTRREYLEDLKRMEGDPTVRGRRRRKAASRAGESPGRLAHASVVVAGQDRAVALQFFPGRRASRVVARGARKAHAKLIEAARDFGVPVLADRELAEVLFGRCGVGSVAPRTAHRAVAEFLDRPDARHRGTEAPDKS